MVVTIGRNLLLDTLMATTFYVGLIDSASFTGYSSADTMGSHAGWIEAVGYSEGVRQTYSVVAASGGSVTNSGSKAVFTILTTTTIRGVFLTTGSAKSGTAGTLYGVADLTVVRNVIIGNLLHLTITLTD